MWHRARPGLLTKGLVVNPTPSPGARPDKFQARCLQPPPVLTVLAGVRVSTVGEYSEMSREYSRACTEHWTCTYITRRTTVRAIYYTVHGHHRLWRARCVMMMSVLLQVF